MAFLVRGRNSWNILPLQPGAAHSCLAIFFRWLLLKNPPIAARCSPLSHGSFSQWVIPQKSSNCRFIAGLIYMAVLVRGRKSSIILPLHPIASHSYIAILVRANYLVTLTSIYPHRQITLPHSYNDMGGFKGVPSTRAIPHSIQIVADTKIFVFKLMICIQRLQVEQK